MHAPAAGRTWSAPPGDDGDGGAGTTLDDAAIAVDAGAAAAMAGDQAAAEANRDAHNAAVALVLKVVMNTTVVSRTRARSRARPVKGFSQRTLRFRVAQSRGPSMSVTLSPCSSPPRWIDGSPMRVRAEPFGA